MATREDLLKEIDETILLARKLGQLNYVAAYAMIVVSLLSVVGATILAGQEAVPPVVRSIVTALSGLAVLANGALRLQEKSDWHWTRAKRCQTLARQLRFENADLAEVSKAFSQSTERLEELWPKFDPNVLKGASGGAEH